MKDDIRPPIQPPSRPPTPPPTTAPSTLPPPVPAETPPPSTPNNAPTPPSKKMPIWKKICIIAAALFAVAVGSAITWYQYQLQPLVSEPEATRVQVTIPSGSGPEAIADLLADKQVIRHSLAFEIHARLQGVEDQLQAGQFSLSPSDSTPEIVQHLQTGSTDQFPVTFYPGATLQFEGNQTPTHRQVLERLGYSDLAIDEAFTATYDHPLFQDKPAEASLEGYIYGQTYQVAAAAGPKQVLTRTFDEYYQQLTTVKTDNGKNIIAGIKAQGLSLHEGIILASIIQREVADPEDQKQVAQVFYKRLAEDMPLGADATFIYAAHRLGVPPAVNVDSPYNTRRYKGLPPGPISSPGLTALKAVANPAPGDFLYFVSGDDGTTYFSETREEHEATTRKYCIENCNIF